MKCGLALVLLAACPGPAGAEPISGKAAKKALFAPAKAEVELLAPATLSAPEARALAAVAATQAYYGAIALSPDEGLMAEATVAAVNYHDTGAAQVAALAGCNAKKKAKADCVIAALIRPKGRKDAGFGLSSDATAAFKDYDRKAGAMAISPSTGAWGMAAGVAAAEAALADCVAKVEARSGAKPEADEDCVVAIAN
jgi:hypothetical protein